ncbi:MAG: epoxyqueuosine reductase QueH [Deltaproteobacteria bacterium]|jgi:predicted adenine nucleotide alpha hydrolase (AANH) superfamily ATPase|nr:epoxyqueuosine reductase QueH [Deltaproteobacteria bacterium]
MKNLFLHACCAPCSIYPLKTLKTKDPSLSVLLWYYNPNIHPSSEHGRRRDALSYLVHSQGKFLPREGTPVEVDFGAPYDAKLFLERAAKAESREERCRACYDLRLKATAGEAKKRGYERFSSTLLFSVKQSHEDIVSLAREAAELNDVEFYYEDFRVGHKEGRALSFALDIYRQRHCGCVYGEAGL